MEPLKLADLLYRCIRELEYVQCVPDSLKASSLGRELVEEGMKELGIPDLAEDVLVDNEWYPRWKPSFQAAVPDSK